MGCGGRFGTGLERQARRVQRATLTKVSFEQVAVGGSVYMCGSPHGPPHVHPDSYENGFPTGDHELFTTFSWDDQKVRRVFIRKVTASPQLSRTGGLGWGSPLRRPWPIPQSAGVCRGHPWQTAPAGRCILGLHPTAPCYAETVSHPLCRCVGPLVLWGWALEHLCPSSTLSWVPFHLVSDP